MNLKQLILIALLLIGIEGCKNAPDKITVKPLPRDLNEAIAYLNNKWSFYEKFKFRNQSEDDAVRSLHYSTGLWIRNTWIRGDRDTSLINYFNKIGIFAADDMSSIILLSFHHQLNNKPLDVKGQVEMYKAYWKSISDCETETDKIAMLNYNKYKPGDRITIVMIVDTSDHQRTATVNGCPNTKWDFNPKKDLLINGMVTEKHFVNDSTNVFFKVRISAMNFPNTSIFSDTVKIGGITDLSLRHLIIKVN